MIIYLDVAAVFCYKTRNSLKHRPKSPTNTGRLIPVGAQMITTTKINTTRSRFRAAQFLDNLLLQLVLLPYRMACSIGRLKVFDTCDSSVPAIERQQAPNFPAISRSR